MLAVLEIGGFQKHVEVDPEVALLATNLSPPKKLETYALVFHLVGKTQLGNYLFKFQ